MNTRVPRAAILSALVITAPACGSGDTSHAPAEALPPSRAVHYDTFERWPVPNGGYTAVIVIDSSDATEAKLRMLGEELRYDTRLDRNAFVLVFDSRRAAELRRAASDDRLSGSSMKVYERHFVASYTRNANTGHNAMVLTPKGLDGPSTDVTYPSADVTY